MFPLPCLSESLTKIPHQGDRNHDLNFYLLTLYGTINGHDSILHAINVMGVLSLKKMYKGKYNICDKNLLTELANSCNHSWAQRHNIGCK